MKRNTGIHTEGQYLTWMLDFRPDSAENEYGTVEGTVQMILTLQMASQKYQWLKKYFFLGGALLE